MDEHYLNEHIFIKDKKTFYNDKLIKKHNWHFMLSELGWEKLHKRWITKLNKLYNAYPNNSLFGALECGDDGDCLFHCISYSLNSLKKDYYDSNDIRHLVSESVSEQQFNDIISCYRSMKDIDDFDESWNPYEIDTLEKFKYELKKSGNSYWGDHLIIQLLMQTFNINIFILSQNEIIDNYEPYNIALNYDDSKNSIVLLHINNNHFKLLGYFNDIMITYFTHSNLPLEIKRLFNL